MFQISLKKLLKNLKKNTFPLKYVIEYIKLLECFPKKKLQKTNQIEFRVEKIIDRKGDNLYVKWKGYDNSFNSWIHKINITMSYFPKPYNHTKKKIKIN